MCPSAVLAKPARSLSAGLTRLSALSGLAAIQADGESGRPKMIHTIIPDKTTAVRRPGQLPPHYFAVFPARASVKLAMLDIMVSYYGRGMAGMTLVGREVKPRAALTILFLPRTDSLHRCGE